MYSILAYCNPTAAAGATYADTPSVTDPSFSARNGHWIFTEDYDLVGVGAFGTSLTAVQLFDSTFNSLNIPQVYPINLSPTPPSNPQLVDLRSWPIQIPQNEEIAFQASNNLALGTEFQAGLLWVAPRGMSRALPPANMERGASGRVKGLFTCSATTVAGAWTTDLALTNVNLLYGGVYTVVGAQVFSSSSLAYRVKFVNQRQQWGRKLFPGNLVENAYGNIPLYQRPDWLGPLGTFDTFELPLISLLGVTAAGPVTVSVLFDMIFRGKGRASDYSNVA